MDVGAQAAVCRTCLRPQKKMLSLRESLVPHLQEVKTHLECLRSCTKLELPLGQIGQFVYPDQICVRCSKALEVSYHFITLAFESERVLHERVRQELAKISTNERKCDLMDFDEVQEEKPEAVSQLSEAYNSQFNKFLENYLAPRPSACDSQDIMPSLDSPVEGETDDCKKISEVSANIELNNSFCLSNNNASLTNHYRGDNGSVATMATATTVDEEPEEPIEESTSPGIKRKDLGDMTGDKIVTTAMDKINHTKIYYINDLPKRIEQEYIRNQQEFESALKKAQESIKEENVAKNVQISLNDCDPDSLPTDILTDGDVSVQIFQQEEIEENPISDLKTDKVDNGDDLAGTELVCLKCDKDFSDMPEFVRHRKRHQGFVPFHCDECNFLTTNTDVLREHCIREHDMMPNDEMLNKSINPYSSPLEEPYQEITYKCLKCNAERDRVVDIEMHISNEHPLSGSTDRLISKVYHCPDCYRTFNDRKNMHLHVAYMHEPSLGFRRMALGPSPSVKLFPCESCSKVFVSPRSLDGHQWFCQRPKIIECPRCYEQFDSSRKFERHLTVAHNLKTVQYCEVCGMKFNSTKALRHHRRRHAERNHRCPQCPSSFGTKCDLHTHVEQIHATIARKWLCGVCGEQFTSEDTLQDHETKEHIERVIKRGQCNYGTRCRVSMRSDDQDEDHTGHPHKCEECDKRFPLRTSLRRHVAKVHTLENYSQEFADKSHEGFGCLSRCDVTANNNNDSANNNNITSANIKSSSTQVNEVIEGDIPDELKAYGLGIDAVMNDSFTNDIGQQMLVLPE